MDEVRDLIRAHQWSATEHLLASVTGETPPPAEVRGWSEVDAALSRLSPTMRVTAVQLDLSNHTDPVDAEAWWDKEPCVEVCVHDDHAFAFSTASDADVLAAGERYPAPWTGRMHGAELPVLTLHGLRDLNGRALQREDPRDPLWWWVHLRFQQAVAGALAGRGLALAVPVVTGTHEVGPWLVAVHHPAKVSAHQADTERITDARQARLSAQRDAETERVVDSLRWLRGQVRGRGLLGRGGNKEMEPLAEEMVGKFARWSGVPRPTRRLARMSDAEVEALIDAYRVARRG